AAAAAGGHGEARDLLGLDARGDGGVPEQRLRDPEPRHRAPDALAEQIAAKRQEAEAREEADQREARAPRRFAYQGPTRADPPRERDGKPGEQQRAVEPREPAVERKQHQGGRSDRRPGKAAPWELASHRRDQG